MTRKISATEFRNLVASGQRLELIDVRTPVEFREVRVEFARNEPLDRLNPSAIQTARNESAQEPLYVICRSGARSKQACEKLAAAGITNVVDVEGGTMAAVAAGLPVVRGKKAIPLHCQVQMITGFLVLLGAVLSMFNAYWIALPIAMGAGLLFSGMTNTCVMGTGLSRMPWNQCKDETCSA
ncbi:MAG: rhodanese-like domain-containing protein [Pirellulaceae bacterium]